MSPLIPKTPPSRPVSVAEKADGERQLWDQTGIRSRGPSHTYPTAYGQTLQKISDFRNQRFSQYQGLLENKSGATPWKKEIVKRTRELVEVAARLLSSPTTEMKWRLDVEPRVFSQLEKKIEWYTCQLLGELQGGANLKQYAVPDVTAGHGDPKSKWLQRPPDRLLIHYGHDNESVKAAPVPTLPRVSHCEGVLNKIVTNRAEEQLVYSRNSSVHIKGIQGRRPDRVYGIPRLNGFKRTLQQALSTVEEPAANRLNPSPFRLGGEPLDFPFLITEAKTGDNSFDRAMRQAAFPIMTFLKTQEALELVVSGSLREAGGPLVWYFANCGEQWQVYGCYMDQIEHGRDRIYCIHSLWSGRIDDLDGALQLLLIVDYVFDWTRDLYRPMIYNALRSISSPGDGAEMAADSEIFSLAPQRSPVLGSPAQRWLQQRMPDTAGTSTQAAPEQVKALLADFKFWNRSNNSEGCIRHIAMAEFQFRCLFVKGEAIWDLLSAFGPRIDLLSASPQSDFVQSLWELLNKTSLRITEYTLEYLEEQWTQKRGAHEPTAEKLDENVAVIEYHTRFSRDWKRIRVLSCVCFDDLAIDLLENCVKHQDLLARPSGGNGIGSGSLSLLIDDVIRVVGALLEEPLHVGFASALAGTTRVLEAANPVVAEFRPQSNAGTTTYDLFHKAYNQHTRMSPETDEKMFRLSSLSHVPGDFEVKSSSNSRDSDRLLQFLLGEDIPVLVHRQNSTGKAQPGDMGLCIFVSQIRDHLSWDLWAMTQMRIIGKVINAGMLFTALKGADMNARDRLDSHSLDQVAWARRGLLRWYRCCLLDHMFIEGSLLPGTKPVSIDPVHGFSFEGIDDPWPTQPAGSSDASVYSASRHSDHVTHTAQTHSDGLLAQTHKHISANASGSNLGNPINPISHSTESNGIPQDLRPLTSSRLCLDRGCGVGAGPSNANLSCSHSENTLSLGAGPEKSNSSPKEEAVHPGKSQQVPMALQTAESQGEQERPIAADIQRGKKRSSSPLWPETSKRHQKSEQRDSPRQNKSKEGGDRASRSTMPPQIKPAKDSKTRDARGSRGNPIDLTDVAAAFARSKQLPQSRGRQSMRETRRRRER